jgi:hypothetical protein
MKRSEVYEIIDRERFYQNKKWNEETTNSRGIHTEYEWLVFIQDYLTEAMHIASRNPEPQARLDTQEIIRKITAMGVCCMEQNGCSPRILKY